MLHGAVLAILFGSAFAQQMQLATNYSGSAFFDLWNYKVGDDTKNFWGDPANEGIVNFTDQAFAQSQQLLYVNPAGNVIARVDNFTNGAGNSSYVRNSIQLLSKEFITPGSLVIMDAVHMPFGCAVWPAFWLSGGANWPLHGEIDIVENVNLATTNAYSLHTENGCKASSQVTMTGDLVATDCFNGTNFDTGCKVVDTDKSYGAGFAANGGGAFAFLWNDVGMQIWFFTRSAIPSDLATANPNPAGWGTPTAFYPSTTCNFPQFFGPQTMILEIDVCGNFAVDDWTTCSTVAATCPDVVPNATVFDNAYFEIKYITVFSNSTTGNSTTGTSTGVGSTTVVNGGSTVVVTVDATSSGTAKPSPTSKSAGYSLHSLNPLTAMAGIATLILAFASL